jgi:hypothetical protein
MDKIACAQARVTPPSIIIIGTPPTYRTLLHSALRSAFPYEALPAKPITTLPNHHYPHRLRFTLVEDGNDILIRCQIKRGVQVGLGRAEEKGAFSEYFLTGKR